MGVTDSSTLARVLHNPAAHHAAIAARLVARFDGEWQLDGDVICRCPFCDHPTARYERGVGIFWCFRCGAKCDGATIGAADSIRTERATYTALRTGALAVALWNTDCAGISAPGRDAHLERLSLACDFCDIEDSDYEAQFHLTGLQRGGITCHQATHRVQSVMRLYGFTVGDLDALIVPPAPVIDVLRSRGAIQDEWARWAPRRGFTIICQFAMHEDRNGVPAHAQLDADLGVYWCADCNDRVAENDDSRAHRGAFGTLGQLADYLRLDLRPAETGTTAAHAQG